MLEFNLHIPFDPVPWTAPRLSKHRCYDPREKDKRAIRFLIREQYTGPLITNRCALIFHYYFAPPKSASAKKKAAMLRGEIIPTKCDCTNLQKLYEDCLKGIVIEDDRIVECVFSAKKYAPKGEVRIQVLTS